MTARDLAKKNLTIDPWAPAKGDMVLDPATTKSASSRIALLATFLREAADAN